MFSKMKNIQEFKNNIEKHVFIEKIKKHTQKHFTTMHETS